MPKDDLNRPITELEIPLRNGPEAYLAGMFNALAALDHIFTELQSNTDIRPYYMVRQIIVRITDDNIRKSLLKKLDEEIGKIDPKLNPDERGMERNRICQVFIGEVIGYFDEFVGISKKQILSEV